MTTSLSAEHGLIRPDQVLEPYDRHLRTRMPAPFGPTTMRQERRWDRRTKSWTNDPTTLVPWHDHRTPWWWDGLKAQARAWIEGPRYDDRPAPSDCLWLGRHADVQIEIHGGVHYVNAIRHVIGGSVPLTTWSIREPLAGLTLGHRLRWYSQARSAA